MLRANAAWLQKQLVGTGEGEKVDFSELQLKLDGLMCRLEESEAKLVQHERWKKARERRPVPAETFAHLPVKETLEIVPDRVKGAPESK